VIIKKLSLTLGEGAYLNDTDGTPSCGTVCDVKVKAKDYVFHPYQMR
jgi:hypothetical protein